MGFRQGAYAKVWSVEDKGRYAICRVSVSKKDKESETYKVEFNGYVNFAGTAYNDIKNREVSKDKGLTIKISSCDVTTNYDINTKKNYVNYAIFGYEIPDSNNSNNTKTTKNVVKKSESTKPKNKPLDMANDDLPF